MKQFQATFNRYGEHIKVPVEAKSKAQASGIAKRDNPMLASWFVGIEEVKEGHVAQDDRATLTLEYPRMGRPSQGRDKRIQAQVTPDVMTWLQEQKQSGETISDVIFRLLDNLRKEQ